MSCDALLHVLSDGANTVMFTTLMLLSVQSTGSSGATQAVRVGSYTRLCISQNSKGHTLCYTGCQAAECIPATEQC